MDFHAHLRWGGGGGWGLGPEVKCYAKQCSPGRAAHARCKALASNAPACVPCRPGGLASPGDEQCSVPFACRSRQPAWAGWHAFGALVRPVWECYLVSQPLSTAPTPRPAAGARSSACWAARLMRSGGCWRSKKPTRAGGQRAWRQVGAACSSKVEHAALAGLVADSGGSCRVHPRPRPGAPALLPAGTSVELDAESQVEVGGLMEERGQIPVGWYHSHPVFEPRPSQKGAAGGARKSFAGQAGMKCRCSIKMAGAAQVLPDTACPRAGAPASRPPCLRPPHPGVQTTRTSATTRRCAATPPPGWSPGWAPLWGLTTRGWSRR